MNFVIAGFVQAVTAVLLWPWLADRYAYYIRGDMAEMVGGGLPDFVMGSVTWRVAAVAVYFGWWMWIQWRAFGAALYMLERESCSR